MAQCNGDANILQLVNYLKLNNEEEEENEEKTIYVKLQQLILRDT